ncbi:MAG TPA: S8 family serine peptidase [Thermoanaerobaculia bacterium]|nr:S8 family serine peptidase [Thermoanaerobaculia bacterium]
MWRKCALLMVLSVLAVPAAFAGVVEPRVPLAAPERPRWISPEILVGLNDRVTECAEARFRLGGSLRSPSLDELFQRFGVRDVRAVFRTVGEGPVAPAPLAELRRREQETAGRPALGTPELFHVYRLTLAPDADVEAAVAAFRQDPHVELAEPNFLAYTQTLPNDSFADSDRDGAWDEAEWGQPFADLWGLERTGWGEVWERQKELWPDAGRIGGGGITVAVLDTGVDYRHPDLAANIWRDSKGRPGRDFVDIHVPSYVRAGFQLVQGEDYRKADSDPSDRNGHGTHVAGTIAAIADNGRGIAGVAWKARVMPLRVGFTIRSEAGEVGLLEIDDVAAALVYAADQGADVVNMSFGGFGEEPQLLRLALKYAHDHGVVLVASAGNDAADAGQYFPASDPRVICVGATVSSDLRVYFSNWGGRVDLAAPGSEVVSLRGTGTTLTGLASVVGADRLYIRASGTSMAAPHVAGAAALVLSRYPDLAPEGVLARLAAASAPTGETTFRNGRFHAFGSGRLDMLRALEAETQPSIVLHSYEVLEDRGDGDKVPEPSERVRLRVSLKNAGRTLDGVTFGLEANGLGATVTGDRLTAGRWRAGEVRTLGAVLEVASGTPRNVEGAVRAMVRSSIVRGAGFELEIPVPLVLNGPADKRGWPVKGLQVGDGLVTAPTLGDVDGDGRPEVVAMTMRGDVFVRGSDGRPLPGWPVRFQGNHEQASPLVADLDGIGANPGANPGSAEIVLAVNRQVHVLDKGGRPLPGWPRPTTSLVLCSPAAGDVDGDGDLEVVVIDEQARLYVFDAAGKALPGWPRKVGAFSNTTPALVDLDGEPGMEILTGTTDGWLVALRADGIPAPGSWPVLVGMMGPASPAAGDLDGDGEIEIVAVTAAGALAILDRRGTQGAAGRVAGQYSFSSPALGDLDGDGRAEIAVGGGQGNGSGFISLFDAEGVMMPGWPLATGADVSASAALLDLDGDGRREVVVPDLSGQLHALRADASPLPGWPRDLDGWVLSSPVAADLDGDGGLEVVLGRIVLGLLRTPIAMTYAIETGPSGEGWPTFKGDPRRTGGAPPVPPPP